MEGPEFYIRLLLLTLTCCNRCLAITEDRWIYERFQEMEERDAAYGNQIKMLQQQLQVQDDTIRKLGGAKQRYHADVKCLQRQGTLEKQVNNLHQQLLTAQQKQTYLEKQVNALNHHLMLSQQAKTYTRLQTDGLLELQDMPQRSTMVSGDETFESRLLVKNSTEVYTTDVDGASIDKLNGSAYEGVSIHTSKLAGKHSTTKHGRALSSKSNRVRPISSSETGTTQHIQVGTSEKKETFNLTSTSSEGRDGGFSRRRRLLMDGSHTNSGQDELIAFHAVIDGTLKNASVGNVVVFDTALLNMGNDYHPAHGIFIAPKTGLYIISVSLASMYGDVEHIESALLKNGDIIGRTFVSGEGTHREQGSITVVTQLQVDDEVWVKTLCCDGEQYYGHRMSSFTGVLLFEM